MLHEGFSYNNNDISAMKILAITLIMIIFIIKIVEKNDFLISECK